MPRESEPVSRRQGFTVPSEHFMCEKEPRLVNRHVLKAWHQSVLSAYIHFAKPAPSY